jgi:GNAT superfamily N-acetyltransferase
VILLPKERYSNLGHCLDQVNFNHLFASAVINGTVSGKVYVDSVDNPGTFYIVHRYGMSLLVGDHSHSEFNAAFKEHALNADRSRNTHEWMQVFPVEWNAALRILFDTALTKADDNRTDATRSLIELNTRVNFEFNRDLYYSSRIKRTDVKQKIEILKDVDEVYHTMEGSVVPKAFWDSADDFKRQGVGFGLYHEGKLAAVAFSSFVAPGKLELGIETVREFRGLGLAEVVCGALIDHCIDRNLEPVWACRLENTGSYLLAKKLGFVPCLELPYYRLSN